MIHFPLCSVVRVRTFSPPTFTQDLDKFRATTASRTKRELMKKNKPDKSDSMTNSTISVW